MAITLDSILNVVIPMGIVIFLFFLFYSKFKDTFDAMFRAIAGLFSKVSGKGSAAKQNIQERYEYVYRV